MVAGIAITALNWIPSLRRLVGTSFGRKSVYLANDSELDTASRYPAMESQTVRKLFFDSIITDDANVKTRHRWAKRMEKHGIADRDKCRKDTKCCGNGGRKQREYGRARETRDEKRSQSQSIPKVEKAGQTGYTPIEKLAVPVGIRRREGDPICAGCFVR
jgi:hypothetical protein